MAALDFNMPLLSVHMESLKDTSPVLVGVMFVILASSYALVTPVVGSLVKTRVRFMAGFIGENCQEIANLCFAALRFIRAVKTQNNELKFQLQSYSLAHTADDYSWIYVVETSSFKNYCALTFLLKLFWSRLSRNKNSLHCFDILTLISASCLLTYSQVVEARKLFYCIFDIKAGNSDTVEKFLCGNDLPGFPRKWFKFPRNGPLFIEI